jgi:malonyl-CoA O-methyltransferase
MSSVSLQDPPPLAILPSHVAVQTARRKAADLRFLSDEVSDRLRERLDPIRLEVSDALDAGCGDGYGLLALRRWRPAVRWIGLDANRERLAQAAGLHPAASVWQRMVGRAAPVPSWVCADMADSGLPAESLDLVWSCLALHWHHEPHSVLLEWWRLLRPGGLVAFATLGPGSFQELRQAVEQMGESVPMLPLVDMHDHGDLLVRSGFADPVMDQETLTLTYASPQALLRELRRCGGNPAQGRAAGLRGRRFMERLIAGFEPDSDGRYRLTLEVCYGHAWRGSQQRRSQETRIPLSSLRRTS